MPFLFCYPGLRGKVKGDWMLLANLSFSRLENIKCYSIHHSFINLIILFSLTHPNIQFIIFIMEICNLKCYTLDNSIPLFCIYKRKTKDTTPIIACTDFFFFKRFSEEHVWENDNLTHKHCLTTSFIVILKGRLLVYSWITFSIAYPARLQYHCMF